MRVGSLVVTGGPLQGKTFDLAMGIATLGRDQTNSIQLSDPEVSRRHAELHFRDDEFIILDLGSSNGISVISPSFISSVDCTWTPVGPTVHTVFRSSSLWIK